MFAYISYISNKLINLMYLSQNQLFAINQWQYKVTDDSITSIYYKKFWYKVQ